MANTGKEGHSGTQYPPGTNEAGPFPAFERRTGSEAEGFPPTEDAGGQPTSAGDGFLVWDAVTGATIGRAFWDAAAGGFWLAPDAAYTAGDAPRPSDALYPKAGVHGDAWNKQYAIWEAAALAERNADAGTAPATDDTDDASTTANADADANPDDAASHPAWNRTWYRPRFR
jgi:hypothetical protein